MQKQKVERPPKISGLARPSGQSHAQSMSAQVTTQSMMYTAPLVGSIGLEVRFNVSLRLTLLSLCQTSKATRGPLYLSTSTAFVARIAHCLVGQHSTVAAMAEMDILWGTDIQVALCSAKLSDVKSRSKLPYLSGLLLSRNMNAIT